MSDSSRRAVSSSTGVAALGPPRRIARSTVMPSRPGQHDVQHDQVHRLGAQPVERVLPGGRLEHVPAFEAQVQPHQLADVRLVFGHQDAP